MSIQFIYSDLDAKSINITYLISKNAVTFDDGFRTYVEQKYNVHFHCNKVGVPSFGEEINYVISYDFKPFMMSRESMTVSIERFAIIGYYG